MIEIGNRIHELGWIVSKEVVACMTCHRLFGVMKRKHHCRACGIVVNINLSNKIL